MNDQEMETVTAAIENLWPNWEAPRAARDIFRRRLWEMRCDWFLAAIEEVAITYASDQPKIAWFFKAYNAVKRDAYEVQRAPNPEAQRIARAGEEKEVLLGAARMTSDLKTLSDEDRRICVDRVNAMGCFDHIPGIDVEKWTAMQRGLVWGRWQQDLQIGEGVAA